MEHREVLNYVNNGKFVSSIELLAKCNPGLKQLINMPKGSFWYFSKQFRTKPLNYCWNVLKERLLSKSKNAPFFSVVMDAT